MTTRTQTGIVKWFNQLKQYGFITHQGPSIATSYALLNRLYQLIEANGLLGELDADDAATLSALRESPYPKEIFVHRSSIIPRQDGDQRPGPLLPGEQVEFDIFESGQGQHKFSAGNVSGPAGTTTLAQKDDSIRAVSTMLWRRRKLQNSRIMNSRRIRKPSSNIQEPEATECHDPECEETTTEA